MGPAPGRRCAQMALTEEEGLHARSLSLSQLNPFSPLPARAFNLLLHPNYQAERERGSLCVQRYFFPPLTSWRIQQPAAPVMEPGPTLIPSVCSTYLEGERISLEGK